LWLRHFDSSGKRAQQQCGRGKPLPSRDGFSESRKPATGFNLAHRSFPFRISLSHALGRRDESTSEFCLAWTPRL
jgi:hypothetical protein